VTHPKAKNNVLVVLRPLLVSAGDAAIICGVSAKYFRQLDVKGQVPAPVEGFGRRRLWSVKALDEWINKGCPVRREFERGKR